MCSRYSLHTKQQTIEQYFNIQFKQTEFQPKFNIAPFQKVLCLRRNATPTPEYLSWGIKKDGWDEVVVNARSETVSSKPLFRNAFQTKRCLIIADGFYEWQHLGKSKKPFYIKLKSSIPFAFAGISSAWHSETNADDSCVILTVPSNASIHAIHQRMPVILHPNDYLSWLNDNPYSNDAALSLLKPFPDSAMIAYPVSDIVNSVNIDNMECIKEQSYQEPFQRSLL